MAQIRRSGGATARKITSKEDIRSRFLAEYTKQITEEDIERWHGEVKGKEEEMGLTSGLFKNMRNRWKSPSSNPQGFRPSAGLLYPGGSSTSASESVSKSKSARLSSVLDFKTTSSLPSRLDEPHIPSSEVETLQKTNAVLEETIKNLKEELKARRAENADVQARLDAEIVRTTELDRECEELWRDDYHWRRLRRRFEEKLRGREEDKRKVEKLELMINELKGIHQECDAEKQAYQERIKAEDDEFEDLKRVYEHLKGEIERYCRLRFEFEKKVEIARTDLETFMDEQGKVPEAALMDQSDRARAERDDILANFEYCVRERDTIKAKLEAERVSRSTYLNQHQLAEIHKALYIADLKSRSDSYARHLSEQAALQSVAKDQEANTILSLQGAIACLADSSLQTDSASQSRLAPSHRAPRSNSKAGSALGKRKRVSSRPSSPDHQVSVSEETQDLSPLFTPAEAEYKGKADLGIRPKLPPLQSRRPDIAAKSRQEARSTRMDPASPPAPSGTFFTPADSLTDGDNGPKSTLSGGLGFLQCMRRRALDRMGSHAQPITKRQSSS
ncbi:hypothetical protein PQX77_021131 [Marasmius sp. AFHP31]|nr:hypothetical protein PQX77_021131 [Marasmius sp. AFHP31]